MTTATSTFFSQEAPILFLGQPEGSFTLKAFYNQFENYGFADFDKDGHLDAACAAFSTNGSFSLAILHGNSDGTFNTTPLLSVPLVPSDFTGVLAASEGKNSGSRGDEPARYEFNWSELSSMAENNLRAHAAIMRRVLFPDEDPPVASDDQDVVASS
jgi:hypothetical protein